MKTIKILIIIMLVAFIFTGCTSSSVLSKEEIIELRQEYPISELDFGNMSLDMDAYDTFDGFEFAKSENALVIIGTISNSGLIKKVDIMTDENSKDYEMKEKILEDKGHNIGIMEYQTFEIIVEEDPILPYENIKKGDVVTVSYINRFIENNPFTNGIKGIFILFPYSIDSLKTNFDVFPHSFFYITDAEYVIGNTSITSNEKYTGKTLNKVITMIKKVEPFMSN